MIYWLLLFLALPFAQHTAPDVFRVKFQTTAGSFVIEAHRDWAPHGADRFYELVRSSYYADQHIAQESDPTHPIGPLREAVSA